MKVCIKNRQRLVKVNITKTAKLLRKLLILLKLPSTEISVLFVSDRRMRLLNSGHRGVDRTTDVLSFPQYSPGELKTELMQRSHRIRAGSASRCSLLPLGDIVINLHRAKTQAAENNLSFHEELTRLLIHGLLHLLGFDHEQGSSAARRMERKSRELARQIR